MTLYTVLLIKNEENDIRCESYGRSKKNDKWVGAINLYHDGFFHTTLISSDSVFKTENGAVAYMQEIVKQVRALDLLKNKKII